MTGDVFSPAERERYRRHLLLPEIGGQGQQHLKDAHVTLVGAGGLGCPILQYLAAAGVGRIDIVDGDAVEVSNLQRQTLYRTADIGQSKALCAGAALLALNPEIQVTGYPAMLDAANADEFVRGRTLVIEGLDRYAPRYLVNAACLAHRVPMLSAAIGRWDGQIALFDPGAVDAPCYACFVPAPPTDEALCETEGVVGAVPGVVGALAAMEAIKFLTAPDTSLRGDLLVFRGATGTTRRVRLPKDPNCAVCGGH